MHFAMLYTWFSQQHLTPADALVCALILFFALLAALLVGCRALYFKLRKSEPTIDDRVADALSVTVLPSEPFHIITTVLEQWRLMTDEILRRSSDDPGGLFAEGVTKAATTLLRWITGKVQYLSQAPASLATLGSADSYVSALVLELHEKIAPLAEALVTAVGDKDSPHCAKYIHYLGVIADSLQLPMSGEQAYKRVAALLAITKDDQPPMGRPAEVAVSTNGHGYQANGFHLPTVADDTTDHGGSPAEAVIGTDVPTETVPT